jgi:hypothetical protein
MNTSSPRGAKGLALQSVVAAALGLGCVGAWALPAFTLNPLAASPALNGGTVIADNIIVSDYAHVLLNPGQGTFTESGLLSVQSFQLGGSVASSPGLNSTYGLYISFTGAGTQQVAGNPLTGFTSGSFTSLDYKLWGYNGGGASFGFDAASNATTTATGAVVLGSGSLLQGSVSTSPALNGSTLSFVPSANATVTFAPASGEAGFFQTPTGFYNLAFAAFTNTVSQVEVLSATEFRIRQGGGAFNFAATPVPEPETYALMMAGLAAVGFVVNRRKM